MGVVRNIDFEHFPEQSEDVGKSVKVCFHYDTTNSIIGEIVRDDKEEPGITIFKLADNRYVLSTECQYQLL